MCSIPGLPTPGTEVSVLLTRVNLNPDFGLVELWVNMDDGRKHIYEQLREEIQIPKRKFYGSEGKPGDLCLVCISDIWHRARIASIQSETYNVFLIDQGQSHIAISDEFKCLVLKCLHLPEGDSSVACHLMQEETLNVSCQLEKHGQYFYPELLTDTFETVIVTEVIDPNKFFCKLLIFSKAVMILSEQIHQHYKERPDFGDAQPQTCGDPCAAKGTNGRWHRSLLKQNTVTSDGTVVVLHVDEGQTEVAPFGDIRPLHETFLRMPVFTYLCSLTGVKDNGTGWTTDQIEYLKSLLLNQTVVARFDHHNIPQDVYDVTMYAANAACINDCFMQTTGLLPPCKSEQNPNVEKAVIPSAFVSALEDKQYTDLENEDSVEVDYLHKGTFSSTKSLEVNSRIDDVPTSSANDLDNKDSSEHSAPLTHNDGCLSTGFHYNYSTYNIEVGGKEKVGVTCAENVHHFFCQLKRNSHLFDKVMENINQLIGQPQCTDHQLGLDSICFARYRDGQWYRGQIVEMSPKPKVHFVDFGYNLAVDESDIRPFPSEACIARSVPVQAVALGLFDVPDDVPQEVNQWFADHAVSHSLTISVIAKGTKGNLIVELFDGSLNVNVEVRERISKLIQNEMTGLHQQPDQQLSNCSEQGCAPNEYFLTQELMNVQVLTNNTEQNKEEVKSPQESTHSASETENGETSDETVMRETFTKGSHGDSEITPFSLSSRPEDNVDIFKRPDISQNKTEEVFASCIVGPHYFWCQFANTDDLTKLSRTAQEAGMAQKDMMSQESVDCGSPCLALFSSDNQWYRAQVIQRTGNNLHVLFVDYGNESDVDISNVRSLPVRLLEMAPQAFLCYLNGFDESKGSWDDSVYDDFYSLLINKSLKVTVFNMEDHPEVAFPHYAVNIECDNVVINGLMQKYWNPFITEHAKTMAEISQTESVLQGGQTVSNIGELTISTGNVNTCLYKKPNISKNDRVEGYASVIVEPNFFWCQYANTEDLCKVSMLAQEAGQAQQDVMLMHTFSPGSPCLALFSSDTQWYRAQVIQRTDDTLHVLFVDYGNESDVNIKDVRSLPQSVLEIAPQAFLCSLNGFDHSKGSWEDQVYDDFYSLLVDKPLKLTVLDMQDHSELTLPQYKVQLECENVAVNDAVQKYWKSAVTEHVMTESPEREKSLQPSQTEATESMFLIGQSNLTCPNSSEENVNTCIYNKAQISKNTTLDVYASCIVEPNFFWCQYANVKDLSKMSTLAQEAGQAQEDVMFMDTLGPGSPCLALFSSDNHWYRAQVTQRTGDTLHVLFVDYGNESDIEIKDVRSLPVSLLEMAPQAFLCSLDGFEESKGSWEDQVYDDFYSLLVDKPLKLTVVNIEDHSELTLPQYKVQLECENVAVNDAVQKYWKSAVTEHVMTESPEREKSLQCSQTEATTLFKVSTGNGDIYMYKKPKIPPKPMENVYASCIAEPSFFWCQYASSEDLSKVLVLTQEAGQAQHDMMVPETLDPGSPCLALFSSDNQWYRAQVIQRNGDTVRVLFVDYGNESDIDIKDVRSLPLGLLEMAPQAFLCSLKGFDRSKGSWDDQVYDDFYNLLVDKPLRVTVFNMENHSELAVPQYAVEIECEGVDVNTMMEKYWKELDTEHTLAEYVKSVDQDETRTMDGSTEI
ncbi:tudor domain-containing protein 6 isoform X2 [Anabas testudineus]|uniref:tudor domain-containing protein 6 isoform X2 n=1 Tax=Anabas testudineus TaxID=64144 RepID=UPI000E45507F|nr:tudor domain-containing protein 6 isoform X2 [Anabas testudineus]